MPFICWRVSPCQLQSIKSQLTPIAIIPLTDDPSIVRSCILQNLPTLRSCTNCCKLPLIHYCHFDSRCCFYFSLSNEMSSVLCYNFEKVSEFFVAVTTFIYLILIFWKFQDSAKTWLIHTMPKSFPYYYRRLQIEKCLYWCKPHIWYYKSTVPCFPNVEN